MVSDICKKRKSDPRRVYEKVCKRLRKENVMLIRFNVGNFLSFSENESGLSEEFSMISNKNIKIRKDIFSIMMRFNY